MKPKHSVSRGSFIRLLPEGRVEQVVRKILEAIDLGLYSEGQQLPSETELANQFGVATVTLREALGYLRQVDAIETRRGRNGGSFVLQAKELPSELMLKLLDEWSVIELRDLGDEHMAISGMATRLAAKRITPNSFRNISFYIESLGQVDTQRKRCRADARFHIEIAANSQSVRLTHAEIRLQSQLGDLLWLPIDRAEEVVIIQQEHRGILEAIQEGDANLAGARAEAHVRQGIKRLIALKMSLMKYGSGANNES